jgi:AcrR family transcriptional regulator
MKTDYEELSIALLTTATIREAAEKCGISETQVYRLFKDEEFQKVLREKRKTLFASVNDRAIAYREKAFAILCEIAEDGSENSCNRISALKQIFAIGDFARNEELEERLQMLEEKEYERNH